MAKMNIDISDIVFKAIEKIKADGYTVHRWISCSERLPENRERVLVCFRSGTVHIAVWYGDYDGKGAWKVTSQFPTKLYRTGTIPKWMPMPEPPEKERTAMYEPINCIISNRYNAGYKDGVKAGRIAVMKEAIEKFRQLSQDHLDRDRGEPEYHRGKAHAYSIVADMFEMWMEEENDG